MKKVILIIFIAILLISSGCFFVFGRNRQVKKEIIKNDLAQGIVQSNKIVLPVQVQKDNIENKKINIKKDNNLNLKNIINEFKDQKVFIKNDIDNFVQISDKDIVRGEILDNQCVLNIVSRKSELSICDFVKNECSDLECKKFDCIEYKNNWFKVSYYGDFVGSGDKELIYKNENEIMIANLECGNKAKENYENDLFTKLIN